MRKSRYWMFILYPDSAPSDWLESIESELIPCAISPLHDKDLTKDGAPKKPHYHIILQYSGPTTYNHVLEFTRRYNATIPIIPESPKQAYLYLNHSNKPEKYQYPAEPIILNGFSIKVDKSEDDKMSIIKELSDYVILNRVNEFVQLYYYASEKPDLEYLKCVMKNSYYFQTLVLSNSRSNNRIKI